MKIVNLDPPKSNPKEDSIANRYRKIANPSVWERMKKKLNVTWKSLFPKK